MKQLNIISSDSAQAWKAEVERLNRETYELLKDVGTALQEVREDADSTIVDEIYKYGSQIISGSHQVLDGMNQLVSMISGLLSKINELLDTGKNAVKKVIGGIAGY